MREYTIPIPYFGSMRVCDLPSGVEEVAFRERLRLELNIRRLGLR